MPPAVLSIDAEKVGAPIDRNPCGHFAGHLGASIYGGFWAGGDSPIPNSNGIRNDVIEALKAIKVPVLRWPGGRFANEYRWQEGIGPRENRSTMINTQRDGVTENNHLGTREFLELCRPLKCELRTGTVQIMPR